MEKKIMNSYYFMIILFLGLLFVVGFSFRAYTYTNRNITGVCHIEKMFQQRVKDETAEHGERVEYRFRIPDLKNEIRNLAIYTVQQDIKLYMDGEIIYERCICDENIFGSAPGRRWNVIHLDEEDVGKQILIEITSPYKGNLRIEPKVYVGNQNQIYKLAFLRNLVPLCIGLLTFGLGVALLFYAILGNKQEYGGKRLDCLGIFAVNIGIWQIVESISAVIDSDIAIVNTYILHIALLLLMLPFVMFIRGLYVDKENKIWDILCYGNIIQIFLEFLLTILGIADFIQLFWMNALMYGFCFLTAFVMAIREHHKVGMSLGLKRNLIGLVFCTVAVGADFIYFAIYKGKDALFLGAVSFLVYILFVGITSMREVNALIDQGIEADHFKTIAYHDGMTGTLNRVAFEEEMAERNRFPKGCIIVMFDLNNLKECNDNFGHKNGDRYIIESANLISKYFNEFGKCYRIGGDEFCVVMEDGNLKEVENAHRQIEEKLNYYNRTRNDFQRKIACGYAQFEENLDLDLNDTRGRADAAMYRNKTELKSAN